MIITVSQLNRYVGYALKEDQHLQGILVRGEISGFKHHLRSGHYYFTLRDETAAVRAVMFRSNAGRLRFLPEDGMRVVAAASASLYERDGSFQLYVTDMQPDGAGQRALALEALHRRLSASGVFDPAHKRSLPPVPAKIGVVTSDSGAAVHDICQVIGRRFPAVTLCIYPVLVQGEGAPSSICAAIAMAQQECDVLIVGRGGGAKEDLQAFNDERVVMAVYESRVPVISAVGHETDRSLTDFAADVCAPTPSAAAELAVPAMEELHERIAAYGTKMARALVQRALQTEARLGGLQLRLNRQSPEKRCAAYQQQLVRLRERLERDMGNALTRIQHRLDAQIDRLEMLSPLRVLRRGYALVYQQQDGQGERLISKKTDLHTMQPLRIQFTDGEVYAQIAGESENDF